MTEQLNILIVDDNELMVKTLRDIIQIKGYQVEIAYSASEALRKIENSLFDCILSDIKMPGTNGVELYKMIKAQHPGLPFILMTAYATDNLVQEGLEEGVISVLTKPLDIKRLLDFLSNLQKQRSIVIVDDDPEFCRTLGDILAQETFAVTQITNPEGIISKLETGLRTVVILDMKLQGSSGLDILREIKQHYPDMPVVLVTGYGEEVASALDLALEISAHTYFLKPLEIEKFLQTLTTLHHQELGQLLGRRIVKTKGLF